MPPQIVEYLVEYFHIYIFCMYLIAEKRGGTMKDILLLGGIVAGWYILNRFILPRMGIQT